ncbi:class F sortase [Nocardioides cavernae]|uniref:class F sortase n=1 Tax=Nocardioides TaxID=1839 RepID=UPI001F228B6B|nr:MULTISPECIES: class F sortase [Nocardioides]MCK9822604.1 class F sortase [Nocardioides cavernae]
MRPRRLVPLARRTALVGGAVALVVVTAMLLGARSGEVPAPPAADTSAGVVTGQPATPAPPRDPSRTGHDAAPGTPVALRVPALGLRAPVVGVALAADGALVPPADARVVGWWSGGVRPGSRRGAALLTGHTVHDGAGVFDDLARLEVGDAVEVLTRRRVLDFRVWQVREVTRTRLAASASRLFDQTGDATLVLVTCSDWDGVRYLGNTVVVARAEGE